MFGFFSGSDAGNTDFNQLHQEMAAGKAQLVDIREKQEWDQARFRGAVNVPLSGLAKGVGVDVLKKIKDSDKQIFMHCHTGSRVQIVGRILAAYGCTDFQVLTTSMADMAANGFELVY